MYIGELSKLSGASPKAIRLYESRGLLLDIERRGKYRIYNNKDVKFVRLIKDAQTLGVTLSELKELLISRNELNWQSVIELLSKKQDDIDSQINSLILQKNKIEVYRDNIKKCLSNS
ncbi:MerR family transcriptional regulator [Photobacterium sanguinicancri]|uniref:MerR family transcriptional regulator n=1 Tax=Photobacterium sanguinicancri TaxID=875932 RepID=UPI000788A83C|nr:MerR family transcriptional regulator [Photobacterium sanguinicancri]KXI23209.1 transcriptional regulator [Photobacterium sanguinicancri]